MNEALGACAIATGCECCPDGQHQD
jgi:hypothetical protein